MLNYFFIMLIKNTCTIFTDNASATERDMPFLFINNVIGNVPHIELSITLIGKRIGNNV